MICYFCSDNMREKSESDFIGGKALQCVNYNSSKFKTSSSVRHSSFFSKYRSNLADIWTVIILWLEDESVTKIERHFRIRRSVVIKYIMI